MYANGQLALRVNEQARACNALSEADAAQEPGILLLPTVGRRTCGKAWRTRPCPASPQLACGCAALDDFDECVEDLGVRGADYDEWFEDSGAWGSIC